MLFEDKKIPIKIVEVYSSRYKQGHKGDDYLATDSRDEIEFSLEGIKGDRHVSFDYTSMERMRSLYKDGTKIRNNRQWSAISPSDLKKIADNLKIASISPESIGMNLLIEGYDDLSTLPPMTYLVLSPYETFESGREEDVVLVVYAQVLPCPFAGKSINHEKGEDVAGIKFPKAAIGYRGITGWVEKGGIVKRGYNGWILTPKGKE